MLAILFHHIILTINSEELNKIEKDLDNYPNSSLLIITKNQSSNIVKKLMEMGYRSFGENKVQEAIEKFSFFHRLKYELHLIGPLQSNKAKLALKIFNTIQTIDREKLVLEIVQQIKKNPEAVVTKNFFIQVNIGREKQKSGIEPESVLRLYDFCLENNLNITGLMCIPPFDQNSESYFLNMVKIRDNIDKNLMLSMGMSADYKFALKCESNMIRVGSKIFS